MLFELVRLLNHMHQVLLELLDMLNDNHRYACKPYYHLVSAEPYTLYLVFFITHAHSTDPNLWQHQMTHGERVIRDEVYRLLFGQRTILKLRGRNT